jgi:threonine aldolase
MKSFDLRSDTVTRPSGEMRKAMHRAEVGDDVYREDPTINLLQETSAKLTGKKAALFLPSGSMGNLIPLYIQCGRGNEVILHENNLIMHYELASATALAGVMPVPIRGERGIISPEDIAPRIRPDIYYMARTGLIEIENTHNKEGGSCWKEEELSSLYRFARKQNIPVHLDGARVFNAAVHTGIPVKKICSYADTVTFCLSKGLGAPVGSVLCGPAEFIDEARRVRKMLGGGMRQAGILAAAGLYALEHNVDRLREDHINARRLAESLGSVAWAQVDPESVETNILFVNIPGGNAKSIVSSLGKKGVLCSNDGDYRIRFVTSLEVSSHDIREVCEIIEALKV